MNPVFNQNIFAVKEHVGIVKASNNYDIFNPENNQLVLTCREPNLSFFTKLFRFSNYKKMTPFNFEIRTATGELVLEVKRGITIFESNIDVLDGSGRKIGILKQKSFSLRGCFEIYDKNNSHLCTLKGTWSGWDFKFYKDNIELANLTFDWASLEKEFFTTADNYAINIFNVAQDNPLRQLIIAAVMCIDMVFKE